jgi:16S rRNA (guanine1207-N2)-methyltransferase
VSGHYFDDAPGVDDRRQDVVMTAWGHRLTMTTASGVFARDGLDKATDVLLRHDDPPSGTVLDLGCGWGAIACAIAATGATVWAVDVNERALELTRQNADRAGLAVTACRPEDVPGDIRFDAIWSNPPIRVGKRALHELLLTWLPRLTDDGEARLVVGKNLGADSLQSWLTEQGWPTRRVASERGFRVLATSGRKEP